MICYPTLSWHRSNQSLPYPNNAKHQAREWQISIYKIIGLTRSKGSKTTRSRFKLATPRSDSPDLPERDTDVLHIWPHWLVSWSRWCPVFLKCTPKFIQHVFQSNFVIEISCNWSEANLLHEKPLLYRIRRTYQAHTCSLPCWHLHMYSILLWLWNSIGHWALSKNPMSSELASAWQVISKEDVRFVRCCSIS